MKTIKDYILEVIDEKNIDNEIVNEELLNQGIEQYLKDRSIEENLEKYQNNEKLYSKLAVLKIKHFKTYTFHMLVFYFINYPYINELLMIKNNICYRIDHNIDISKEEATDLYRQSILIAGKCMLLEYEDSMIDKHLNDIKRLLKITE